jgi:hypothetical protein
MSTSNQIRARGASSQRQENFIDLTRDSPGPINEIQTPHRPVPYACSSNSTTSSTSTASLSAGSIFDVDAQDTPVTPSTPVDEDPGLSQSEVDPAAAASSSNPPIENPGPSFGKIPAKRRRASAKNSVRATGSPQARNLRRHTRSVSSKLELEDAQSNLLTTDRLSPSPSQSPDRGRASSGPTTPAHRTPLNYAETQNSRSPIPGAFESQSTQVELQNEENIQEASHVKTSSTKAQVKIKTHHSPVHWSRDSPSGFQRPVFGHFRGENKSVLQRRASYQRKNTQLPQEETKSKGG